MVSQDGEATLIKLWVKGGLSGGVMFSVRKEPSASGGGQQVYRGPTWRENVSLWFDMCP